MKHANLICRLSAPMEPIPTGETPRLQRLPDIRALLFDIYGTLLVSGVGDIANGDEHNEDAAQQALAEAKLAPLTNAAQRLHVAIEQEHAQQRASGQPYPEVDIREMWRAVVGAEAAADQIELLAVGYELRVNPVWPMPNLEQTLRLLQPHLALGIISNAQFMTPRLFSPLTGHSLEKWEVQPQLCFYSFEHRAAKPGLDLYQLAAAELHNMGLSTGQALYIGNDRKKDIWPANQLGFRTALFAGDRRSLRLHKNDETLAGVSPDLVITDLSQLKDCLIDN